MAPPQLITSSPVVSDDSSSSEYPLEKKPAVPGVIIKDAQLVTESGNIVTKDGVVVSTEEADTSLAGNIFQDPEVRAFYVKMYEDCEYECRHVFDGDLTWSKEEEKALVRKIDFRVTAWSIMMFFALQVDRANLGQAVSGTFLQDLKLNTNDLNLGTMVFIVSFACAELPSQLVSKYVGPDRWIPTQICLWSIVAICQSALTGKASFLATRSLLGILEGGFIPDLVLYLSYFYTSKELPIRLSFFWTTLSTTGIIMSLAAFGIFHMHGLHGIAGWRWLFMIEGIITFAIGFASFFMMPASAVATKTWFRPNGWFTDRQVAILVNRILRDDPSKGSMMNRQAITPMRLWKGLKTYDLWPLYALGFVVFIPIITPQTYLTLTLRSLKFSTFDTNLLVIPSNVWTIINLLALTWLSGKLNQRALVAIIQSIWTLPCVIALAVWPHIITNAWGTYAITLTTVAAPYCHAILVGWTSRNSNDVGTRSISTALYNMSVQIGAIAGSFVYREDDRPKYRRGNRTLIGLNVAALFLFVFTKVYYVQRNKWKKNKWDAMSKEEQNDYIRNSTDEGPARLDFQFAH